MTQELPGQGEGMLKGKFLTFSTEKEMYGIEIEYVTEIVGIQPIAEVPDVPRYIRGVINLRGKIIPVMDVRLRFQKPFREYGNRTCTIVIHIGGASLGLIVDSVSEVQDIRDEDIVPVPAMDLYGQKYIKGIGKTGNDIKLILDCEKLLAGDGWQELEQIG